MTTIKPVWNDASILRELAGKTMNNATFALNTSDLPGAATHLRAALAYVERLAHANSGIAGNAGDEFAGYDINHPDRKPAPVIGVGFAGYSINAVNAPKPGDDFDGYDLNAL